MSISAANFTSRPPTAAGHFYDADPHFLRAEVGRLLAKAPRPTTSGQPKAIIAPHAGYLYSGQVAAAALVSLERWAEAIKRVVLIGPAHYVRFRGLAIPTVGAFGTPIGPVALDRDALTAIATMASVKSTDAPHTPEHALEVELPFLQMLLPGFKAVPLLVGDAAPASGGS